MSEFKVLSHKIIRASCDEETLQGIVADFTRYKKNIVRPRNFGRDEKYDRPKWISDINLWHIHLRDKTSNKTNWDGVRVYKMTSDTSLIYTHGFKNKNFYLLISLIENAHQYYGGTEKYVREMAQIALDFQNKF